jgi:hypothetical protein
LRQTGYLSAKAETVQNLLDLILIHFKLEIYSIPILSDRKLLKKSKVAGHNATYA